MAEQIWNFIPRKDDIWIVTFPKCGTTLTQELVWQIVNNVQLDSEESKKQLYLRSPFLEAGCIRVKGDDVKYTDPLTYAAYQLKSPRIIKSHLPISMLPPNLLDTSKVLYVGRYFGRYVMHLIIKSNNFLRCTYYNKSSAILILSYPFLAYVILSLIYSMEYKLFSCCAPDSFSKLRFVSQWNSI